MRAGTNSQHAIIFALLTAATSALRGFSPRVPRGSEAFGGVLPSTVNCSCHYLVQPLDHFSFAEPLATFEQRYFINRQFWNPGAGPIFFYTGNEADVELYVNATGLMWENAVSRSRFCRNPANPNLWFIQPAGAFQSVLGIFRAPCSRFCRNPAYTDPMI